jgi:nucleosome assembly protein 1-like 1
MPPKRGGFADPNNMAGQESESDGDAGMQMGGGAPGFDPARFTNPNYSREFMAKLPAQIRKRVSALIGLDKQYMDAKKEYENKRAELLVKFETVAAPLHQERKAIVDGTAAVTEEQVQEGFPEEHRTAEVDVAAAATTTSEADNLSGFWLKALQRHVIVNDMITERDAEIMKFVTDVTCTSLAPPLNGFIVRFDFAKNDSFSNTHLSKTFHLKEIFDELTVERVEGTKIEWASPDKNVTVEVIKKKQKAKIKGKVVHRTIEKTQPCDSFFRFFSEGPISGEGGIDKEGEDDEENEFEELDEDQWLGLAHVLRDKIIPYAVEYYTGEAPDGSSDLEDDEDYGDEEAEEEEEEEDEEPVQQLPPQRRGGGGNAVGVGAAPRGKGGRGGAAGGANPQDCKQQ